MRAKILDALFSRMATDRTLFFLTADMGINLVERFERAYPQRFLNVGIAEQNLIGVSAGLANAGFRPVAYTISNFLTHRCFEQIRNDIALHGYPLTMLGTSSGFDNAALGPTHHIIDDWGAIAGIPGVDIYCPSSVAYAETLLDRILSARRPAYVRIPKGSPVVADSNMNVVYKRSARPAVLLVSYGAPVSACLELAEARADISVLIVNRLRPVNWADIAEAINEHHDVVVVEDHFADNGLYATLCRLAVRAGAFPRLHSIAPENYTLRVGSTSAYYHALYGLDAVGITTVLNELSQRNLEPLGSGGA